MKKWIHQKVWRVFFFYIKRPINVESNKYEVTITNKIESALVILLLYHYLRNILLKHKNFFRIDLNPFWLAREAAEALLLQQNKNHNEKNPELLVRKHV